MQQYQAENPLPFEQPTGAGGKRWSGLIRNFFRSLLKYGFVIALVDVLAATLITWAVSSWIRRWKIRPQEENEI